MAEIVPNNPAQPLNSLSAKLVLLVFAASFGVALAVSGISIQSNRASHTQALAVQYPQLADDAAARIAGWLSEGSRALAEAESAGRAPGVRASADERSAWLRTVLDGAPQFEGVTLCDVEPTESGTSIGPQACTSRTALSTIPLGESEQAPNGLIAGIELERKGTPVRLVGLYDRNRLARLLRPDSLDPRIHVRLVDGQSLHVAGPSPATGEWRRSPIPLGRSPSGSLLTEYTNASGVHVIAATGDLGASGLRVQLEAPFDVAYAPVLRSIVWAFGIDLVVVLLVSFVTFRITNAVLQPIESLSEGARRVAEGRIDLEIHPPRSDDEIALLTRSFNDMVRRVRLAQDEIEARNSTLVSRNEDLQHANEILEQLSVTDGLTQLHNHRFFQDHLTLEIKRVERNREPLALLLVDIDDFKSLNDRFGHAAGDDLLRGLARIMSDGVRDSDLLARYGGEEFAVLASNTDLAGAYALAEKLRTEVAESSFILDESMRPTRVTVRSIGVAEFAGNRRTFFGDADRALYRAKQAGKNCVIVDDPDSL